MLTAQAALEVLEQGLLARLGQADDSPDGGQRRIGVGYGGQIHEEDAVVEPFELGCRGSAARGGSSRCRPVRSA